MVTKEVAPERFSAPLVMTASPFRRLIGSLAVDQPRYAEAIHEHAKTRGPERFLERHYNPTVLGQFVKDTLGVSCALDVQRHREALWFVITIRRDVATHEHLVADPQAAVHDLVGPVGRNLIRQRSSGVTKNRPELAAETLLIELERCLALSLETQIRVHLHGEPLVGERFLARFMSHGRAVCLGPLGISLNRVAPIWLTARSPAGRLLKSAR